MDYKVTDTELTSVANAIRTKGGTSELLEWPDEYISAVNAIPTGGFGSWLHGSADPTSDLGTDGDIYAKTAPSGFICDPEYICAEAGAYLSRHSDTFYKTTDDPAIAVEVKVQSGANIYYHPLLFGLSADAVKYTRNETAQGSFEYLGLTWYYAGGIYADTSTDSPAIPTYYDPMWTPNNAISWFTQFGTYIHLSAGTSDIIQKMFTKDSGAWTNLIGYPITW